MFYVQNVSAQAFVSSHQLLNVLEEYADTRIRLNYLYRRIIAPLRDAGVILASSSQGYKIPVSVEDITTYINQTHTVVSPMLHRICICRNLIKQQTNNDLDVLDDPAFLKYKNYFDWSYINVDYELFLRAYDIWLKRNAPRTELLK